MEPPGVWALRRAPQGLRDGLGGDDDRTEVFARVDEDGAGAKRSAAGVAARAMLHGPAAPALCHRAAAERCGDGEAERAGERDEYRRGIARVGDERGGTARHEAEREAGGKRGKTGGTAPSGQCALALAARHGRCGPGGSGVSLDGGHE